MDTRKILLTLLLTILWFPAQIFAQENPSRKKSVRIEEELLLNISENITLLNQEVSAYKTFIPEISTSKNNSAKISQDGNNNTTLVNQSGKGNQILVNIEGSYNTGNYAQQGNNNLIIDQIEGLNLKHQVIQNGNNNGIINVGLSSVPVSIIQNGGIKLIIQSK